MASSPIFSDLSDDSPSPSPVAPAVTRTEDPDKSEPAAAAAPEQLASQKPKGIAGDIILEKKHSKLQKECRGLKQQVEIQGHELANQKEMRAKLKQTKKELKEAQENAEEIEEKLGKLQKLKNALTTKHRSEKEKMMSEISDGKTQIEIMMAKNQALESDLAELQANSNLGDLCAKFEELLASFSSFRVYVTETLARISRDASDAARNAAPRQNGGGYLGKRPRDDSFRR